jgi:hypothetical protein
MAKTTLTLLSALLLAAAAAAQPPSPAGAEAAGGAPGPALTWRLGFRLGAFDLINSPDSYDAVYGGDLMPQAGVAVELQVGRRWLVDLTYDRGKVDGEQVLPTRPPRGTGVGESLTYRPLALTGAFIFNPQARWRWYGGLGVTRLDWKDEGLSRSASGTDDGAHAVLGLRREPNRWSFGGELRYSQIPNAVGQAGITRFFGEDDLGGLSFHLEALFRLH